MFSYIYNICAILDKRISYVEEAKTAGLGDESYFLEMEKLIKLGLARLKSQSTNKKLIAKYENKINSLYN